jgi:hypothetical protein
MRRRTGRKEALVATERLLRAMELPLVAMEDRLRANRDMDSRHSKF